MTKENEQNAPPAPEKPTTPAKDSKEKEGRKGILNAIRLPLVSVFPRKKNKVIIFMGEYRRSKKMCNSSHDKCFFLFSFFFKILYTQ